MAKEEASCLNSGHEAYWHCDCGAYFADEHGLAPIADITVWLAGDGFIAKLDHEYNEETGICGNGCNKNSGSDLQNSACKYPRRHRNGLFFNCLWLIFSNICCNSGWYSDSIDETDFP